MKIIIDFDGTLTAEETQAVQLAEKSLNTLANEIIGISVAQLTADYEATRARLLQEPHRYGWEVNGLIASYCDEGAFLLNTTTTQVMLRQNEVYRQAVTAVFPQAEYDPIVDCTNYLFHRHSAELSPAFKPAARDVLTKLIAHPNHTPIILTNSLGDKVRRHLNRLNLSQEMAVLGDTRQYDMAPDWKQHFQHPVQGQIQLWSLCEDRQVDLRRQVYYQALKRVAADGSQLVVIADTFSMPGALPLMMGVPFILLRTVYTPDWCIKAVDNHPLGTVLDELAHLPVSL